MPPKLPKGKRMPTTTLRLTSRGKKSKAPPEDSPDSPTPPESDEEAEDREARSRSPSREVTPQHEEASGSQCPKKRVKMPALTLTPDQEEEMADWLKLFDFIYVKGRERYKDSNMKKRVWGDQAKKMGLEVRPLMTWYDSVRSKVGKLTEDKSGSAAKELSDREKHILQRFGFLRDHIVRQPSRVGSSMKAKLLALQPESQVADTATATATCSDSDIPDIQILTQPQSSTSARPPSKPKGKSKSREGDDELMETFRDQQEQSAQLQGRIAGLLEPMKQSAPTSWGTWVGAMAESFNPSLLPQFYTDSFTLVMRNQHETRQMEERQQPRQPAFVPQQQQPEYQQPQHSQVYQFPPPLLQQQPPQQPQPQRRQSSDIDWNTPGPITGRPASTPAALTLSGLSDITFSGLMGDSTNDPPPGPQV